MLSHLARAAVTRPINRPQVLHSTVGITASLLELSAPQIDFQDGSELPPALLGWRCFNWFVQ